MNFYLLKFNNFLIIFLNLIIFCKSQYDGPREGIPFGLIMDSENENLKKIFYEAISVANTDLSIPIEGQDEMINYGNSMQAYDTLCTFMENGIGGIFGMTSKHASKHLLSACDAKDIPFIYPHMTKDSEGFNLYPHTDDIVLVLKAIIEEYNWKTFIFLYENSDYLGILNGLLGHYSSGGPVMTVLRYDLKLNGNFKAVLRRVRKLPASNVVVLGSTPTISEFLKQAQHVGIINNKYSYLIANFDLQTFDLEEYKYSEVNMTGIRMFSPEQSKVQELMVQLNYYESTDEIIQNGSCPITLEMALTYDAVQIIAEVTKNVTYRPEKLNCSDLSDEVQKDGSTFKNYMHSLDLSDKLLTGHSFFDGHKRKGYVFEIIELQERGLVKIGTWDEKRNLTINRPPPEFSAIDYGSDSLANKTFKILITVPNPPHAQRVKTHKRLYGNDQYEGFSIDVIKELAQRLQFNYTFLTRGNDYGSYNKTTNTTTGMLKEIVEGDADLAIADLTITAERQDAVDFTIPFMNLGISILFKKPKKPEPEVFSFLVPFSNEVWIYLGLAYFGVSLSLFILGRLSPTEWDNPYPCIEDSEELLNQFTFNNAMWFSTGALLQQGTELGPKALSTRTIATIWWFFTLIIVSSYTANLASCLTIEKDLRLIENVYELADNKSGLTFGAKRSGATRTFFANSDDPTYKKMNEYMSDNPSLLVEDNNDGVKRVISEEKYAFLMESTTIEYNIVRDCNLEKIGEPLDEKGYGIAMRKEWEYRDQFNNALLHLQEQGDLARLKNKWWNELGAKTCKSEGESTSNPLGMPNLIGVYYVLIGGSALSIIIGLIAWLYMVFQKARKYEVSFFDALKEEWSIVIDFETNERELKNPASVYSRRNSLVSIDSLETDPESNENETAES